MKRWYIAHNFLSGSEKAFWKELKIFKELESGGKKLIAQQSLNIYSVCPKKVVLFEKTPWKFALKIVRYTAYHPEGVKQDCEFAEE